LADRFANLVKIFLEIGGIRGFGILHAECYAHGCSNTNGGGSADDHVADHIGDLLVGGAGYVHFFGGQLRLVDEDYAGFGPFQVWIMSQSSVVGRWSFVVGRWC